MKDNQELLFSVLKTAQMGQTGIRSVIDKAVRIELKDALRAQLSEYDAIERDAYAIAQQRGWEPETLDPAAKKMAAVMSRLRLQGGNRDSKIAAMMINGNTRGMIKSLKNLHRYHGSDNRITVLSQHLLDCERANIIKMQGFL